MKDLGSNYVKYYKTYFNINFSNDYEIHHIDFNRKNNHINNLLLLPKKLHQLYHNILNIPEREKLIFNATICSTQHANYDINFMKNFLPIYEECCKWFDYKKYLLKELPNIHNIQVGN